MCDPGCSSRGSRCHGYRGYPDGRKHSAGYKGVLHFASMGVCVNATNTYNGLMHRDYKLACKEYTHWEIRKQVYGIVAAAGAAADAAADSGCSAVLEDFCRIIDGHIFLAIFSGACAPLWAVNLETSGCNAGGGTRRTTTTRSTFHPLLGANAEGNAGGSCRGMQVEILPAVQRKPAWATTTRVLALHAVGGLLLVGPT
eukprot:gene25420-15106_t